MSDQHATGGPDLEDPRRGLTTFTALVSLLMALHWTPMLLPGVLVLAACLLRPDLAGRPTPWAVLAGLWLGAVVLQPDRMEDHVHLFVAWLLALAASLRHPDPDLPARAARQARLLIGIAFAAAVAWKVWFGDFVTGVALWTFLVADSRFAPLAWVLGISAGEREEARTALGDLLGATPSSDAFTPDPATLTRVAVVAVAVVLLEVLVAVTHLVPDSSRLAGLRLPSLVTFAVATYAVVPVVPFAALLAVLAMATSRWRPGSLWVFPLLLGVALVRFVTTLW